MRWPLPVWLVVLPALVLPGTWFRLDSRLLHEVWSILFALSAVCAWWLLRRPAGPANVVGALGLFLVGQAVWDGLRVPLALYYLSLLAAAGAITVLCAHEPPERVGRCLAWLGALHLAAGGLQLAGLRLTEWVWGGWAFRTPWPMLGIADNPNVAVTLLGLTAPFLAWRLQGRIPWGPALPLLGAALAGLLLWRARSAGGLLVVFAAVLAWRLAGPPPRWRACCLLLAGLLVAGAVYVTQVDAPGTERVGPWSVAVVYPTFTPATAVFGYGLGAWSALELSQVLRGPGGAMRAVWENAHSDYLQTWFEAGGVGALLWLAAGAVLLWRTWSRRDRPVARAAFASSAAFLVAALFYSPARWVPTASAGLGLVLLAQGLGEEMS